jgi:predicted dehydrogenase
VSRLRIAVIGGGHLGRIHTRLLQTQEQVEVVGVVDPVAEARERIATEFSVPTFAHHEEIAGSCDGAIVAATTAHHHEIGVALLSRGIHVFVEKPLTTSVALADEMVALAHDRHLVLQVGHVERFNPAWQAVASNLHRPRFIEAVRTSGYTFRSTDIGVVLDLMIHDLDLVLSIVRSVVVEIDAVGATIFGPHEDLAHAHLRFSNGCVVNLNASRTSFQSQRSMQVLTDRAYVGIDFAANTARLIRPSKELVRGRFNVHDLAQEQKDHLRTNLFTELLPLEQVQVEPGNAILEEQKEFIACIQQGRAPRVCGEHARDCLIIVEQILARIKHPPSGRSTRPSQDEPHILPAVTRSRDPVPPHDQRKAG